MSIILGFGPYHGEVTRKFCGELASKMLADKEEKSEKIAKDFAASIPGTKGPSGKEFKAIDIRRALDLEYCPGSDFYGHTVEGTYSHYNTQHPMSPDGFAMLQIPFCVTVFFDAWGEREYISVSF